MADFLYNGVGPLPKLPEVEGYALLCKRLGFYTVFFFNSYEFEENSETGRWEISIPGGNQMYQIISGDEWTKQVSTDARNIEYDIILWANFDVIGQDGSVYLAASEPVPVTTINPSALMQGFFVGDAIKRNR